MNNNQKGISTVSTVSKQLLSKLSYDAKQAKKLTELYPICAQLRDEMSAIIDRLEKNPVFFNDTSSPDSIAEQQFLGSINSLFGKYVGTLIGMLEAEQSSFSGSQLLVWQKRIQKLADDRISFRKTFEQQLGIVLANRKVEEERKRLFTSTTSRSEEAADAMYMRERNSINESKNLVTSMIQQGRNTVDRIISQNRNLKNAQRRLLDVTSTIGVSSGLLTVITRRHAVDRALVYVCICSSIFFFIFFYNYVHTGHIFGWTSSSSQHK